MGLVKMFESYGGESSRQTAEPGKTFRRRPTRFVFAGDRVLPKRGPGNRCLGTPPVGAVKVVTGPAVGPSGESSAVSVCTQTVERFHCGARGDFARRPSVSAASGPIVDEIRFHGIAYAPEFNRFPCKGCRVRDGVSYGPDRFAGARENVRNEPRFAVRIGYPAKTSERRATTLANHPRKVPEYLRPGFVKRLIERFENGVCVVNVL